MVCLGLSCLVFECLELLYNLFRGEGTLKLQKAQLSDYMNEQFCCKKYLVACTLQLPTRDTNV